ncbi:hypothetical protein P5G51_000105 [Virgibacillus sp. 179-BFC.A HS]|uniref:Uncharacterized protein n=1 Tax=Tigheibacillus jepli TaxID=3035914 RepID=A0ABU5CCU5_9BACI|nr:hypothetical protein [Virgibacillus sp. 179-BFC.A HS]MDY0404030.1 hypothetical protein [Virgibacillus sp. 179-BFC.A HS]
MDNSSLAIVFNKDNTLKSFMEYKLIGNDKNYTVDAAVYINGTLSKEQNVKLEAEDFVDSTDEYENITEGDQNAVAKFIQPVKVEAGFWSKFNKCLADKGVAAWAITSLSIVCGAACVGTAGAGCAACLVGAGLLTEGVVTYCLAKVVSK